MERRDLGGNDYVSSAEFIRLGEKWTASLSPQEQAPRIAKRLNYATNSTGMTMETLKFLTYNILE